ncbi:MAG: hypothetical protein ACYCY9_03690 [Thiobacillus sp.]
MRSSAVYAFSAALLCGCISTKPNNDLGFTETASLASLDGCYNNRGETGKGAAKRFLSAAIWPSIGLVHKDVEAVQVSLTGSDTVRVTAFAGRRIIRQETFVEGKDFTFRSGQITVSRAFGSAGGGAGNVFIGAGVETTTLGVDTAGNGRWVESAKFAGAAFLIIPVAGSVNDATRFNRATELCVAN